jgi:hypothetical protein
MSESEHASVGDADDRVAVTSGGVHLGKWIAESESAVPVVKYEIRSVREDPARVTITDDIPEHLALDDVGFHEEYHGERWAHAGAHTVQFETEVDPEETVTTVYGVRRDAMDDPSAFLGRPDLSVAASASDTDGAAPPATTGTGLDGGESSSTLSLEDPTAADDGTEEADKSEVEGADDAVPEAATESDGEGGDDVGGATGAAIDGARDEPANLETPDAPALEPGDSEVNADESSERTDSSDIEGDSALAAISGGDDPEVVEAFVAALRSDALDAETRAALGEELNLALSASTSQFVEHLQSRAKEKRGQLEADIETVEDSIAELYGTKADAAAVATLGREKADETAVAALREDVTMVADAKADRDDVDSVRESLAELEDVTATEAALADAEAEFGARFGELVAELEALAETAATADALNAVVDDLADLDARTPEQSAFESLHQDHDDLDADVAALASSLDETTTELAEQLASETDAVRSEIDDLEALLTDRMEREHDEIEAELNALDDAKASASALSDATDRVDALETTKADAKRVATVESTLEEEYVTAPDITDTIEARMERSLLSRTLLVAGGVAAGGGVALAATGVAVGGALVVGALAAFAYWWYLNANDLAPTTPATGDATGNVDAAATTEDAEDPPDLPVADEPGAVDDRTSAVEGHGGAASDDEDD